MPIPTLTVTPPPRRCATIASLPLPPIAGAERQNSDAAPTPLLTARTTKHDHPAATSGSNTTISNQRVADAGLDATMVARRREIGQDRMRPQPADLRVDGDGAAARSRRWVPVVPVLVRTHAQRSTHTGHATGWLLRQRYAACAYRSGGEGVVPQASSSALPGFVTATRLVPPVLCDRAEHSCQQPASEYPALSMHTADG